MSTAVTYQSIAFLFPGGLDPIDAILDDSGIQSAFGLSLGNDAVMELIHYYNLTGGVLTDNYIRKLSFFVSASNAAAIIAGIPALITRMQTEAPQVTNIVTWGEQVVFG